MRQRNKGILIATLMIIVIIVFGYLFYSNFDLYNKQLDEDKTNLEIKKKEANTDTNKFNVDNQFEKNIFEKEVELKDISYESGYIFNYRYSENISENSDYKIRLNRAFREIEEITDNQLTFNEVNYDEDKDIDINVVINRKRNGRIGGLSTVQGKVYYPYRDNYVADIYLFLYNPRYTKGYHLIEMHELLHVLGLSHVPNTIMTEDGKMYKQLSYDKTLIEMLKHEWDLDYVRYRDSDGEWVRV
ncbi:matrixin family metalloprotease [Candidatus Pacearchaeota archaeon]|nr:matrixin family metalloprotease [Candidatus Pacearchaeota archaeon]